MELNGAIRQGAYQTVLMTMILLGIVVIPLTPQASAQETKDPLIEHLEFLGYTCDLVEQGIRAKHSSKIPLFITYYKGGIRVQTGFPGKDPTADDVQSRFEVLNTLNKETRVTRFYWSKDGHLFGNAWMPGLYEKSRFATFLEAWEHDTKTLREAYEHLRPYLKEDNTSEEAEP